MINNGNCTEWSAIWSEIKCVITKSHDREAGGLNGKHGAGVPEPECEVKKWKTRSIKYGKHGV